MNSSMTMQGLEASIASGDPVDVRQFRFATEMSTLFEATVVALSENTDIDLEAVVGQPGALTLRWGEMTSRTITGVVRTFRQIQAEGRGLSTYQWTIVPTLWLTTQRRNHRMFQHMSEVDIALKLLDEWSITPVVKLSEEYKKRKYRVQYGESDFRFLCRMLEEAGISFYFDWEADCSLVLSDAPQANPERPALPFRDNPTKNEREHATAVRIERSVRPGKYTIRDHDYRLPPNYKLIGSAQGEPGLEGRLERFDYLPGAFLFESDKGEATPVADDKGKYRVDEGAGQALAQKRLEAKRATAKVVTFETNAFDPAPGSVVSFLDHPKSDLAPGKRYLVVASEMRGARNAEWSHTCRAVSADAPYRPELLTPKPVVSGVESATVVGPPGEEIHTDEFGRVRVHFHWDRESAMDDNSSCWIHVSQPWGGTGFGGTNLPRVGQEVIVDFLGGDPDRPVITGRLYTNLQKTPYKLPDNKTQSGLKSSSSPGGGGYNELMFEDKKGQELVRMQAEKDLNKLVKHDEEVKIGNDRTKSVGHDDSLAVGHDRARQVGNDETVSIGNDRTRLVGNNESVTVGSNRSKSIGVNESLFVGANQNEQIGQDRSVQVGANHSEAIGANMSLTVGMSKSETVALTSTETVGAAKSLTVVGAYAIAVGPMMTTTVAGPSVEGVGSKSINAGSTVSIVCGASKLSMDKGGNVVIEATNMVITASGAVKVKGTGTVDVESSGAVTVKGGTIHMN
jgi:type VI secretion system secreted protein VgrG